MKQQITGLTLLGIACAIGAEGALAQSEGGAASRRTTQLEEVVVTARKRAETVQDVPVTMNAFSSDFVESNAITSVDDVSTFTPGMIAASATGETGGNLFMRGIGSGQHSALLEQSVAVNVDGAQAGGQLMFASLLDLDRIEVLKGPQALFYGKNSPGGVISLITAAPTREFEGNVKLGYEFDAKERYGQAVVSGPLSDNVQGRLLLYRTKSEGYLDIKSAVVDDLGDLNATGYANDTGPQRNEGVYRMALAWQPNDRLSVDGRVTYSSLDAEEGFSMNTQIVSCPTGSRQAADPRYAAVEDCKPNDTVVVGNISDAELAASPNYLRKSTGYTDNQIHLATLNIEYDLTDELSLASVTSNYSVDLDQAANYSLQPLSLLASSTGLESDRYAQEFRLLSSYASPFNFATGLYYETENATAYTNTNAKLAGLNDTEITDQDKTAYSAFAQLIWDINDVLTLEAGARYSKESKKADFWSTLAPGMTGGEKYEADNVSPEATVTYHLSDEIMLYGSYREGFKSGGLDTSFTAPTNSIAGGVPTSYDEETVSGFEGGMKASFLDGGLQTNFAVFTYDYDDMQLSFLDTGTLSVKVVNAAKASLSGAEFDFMWSVPKVPGLRVTGALAYLDAQFDDYLGDCYNGQSIANGCSLAYEDSSGRYTKQDRSGDVMQLAPKWTGSLGVSYDTASYAGWWASFSTNLEYSDEYQADAEGSPYGKQDSYTRTNASARLFSDDGHWELALIVRNLTDEYIVTRASPDTLAASSSGTAAEVPVDMFGSVSRGREVYLEIRRNF